LKSRTTIVSLPVPEEVTYGKTVEGHGICFTADLRVPTIREEMTKFIVKYIAKLTAHPNELVSTLLE
jgi:hypothetical protein